ncbi:AAC(3) family N-acetyltransferase [Paenibacillus sp. SC116]|uniref:aminoglycoside N(3)-acetyltransferase n=1 Tax=Paenibacillus sp. SC116 TaxID=2968986 RepID=UPI00215A6A98|nr:AAC(3) family N-acetyltransferase [Paenibacillus sp. SC116]MCR8844328.1 AAC(3) family N-acetyltransferase [Paenibacillus sp. SC116]
MAQGQLITKERIKLDLEKLGVAEGMTVIAHSSLKSIGRVVGGAVSVILALEEVIGESGSLVMPTQTEQLCDPTVYGSDYSEEEVRIIRDGMPIFHPDLTPTSYMGFIPEIFRKQNGVYRSAHPHVSFAAWGKHAAYITDNHKLNYALSEQSPLGKIYELDGYILLLGAPTDSNSSLHLAEYKQQNTFRKEIIWDVKVAIDGEEKWTTYQDINNDSDDFSNLFDSFKKDTNYIVEGKVGAATSYLIPMRAMVDYALNWMNTNRA